LPETQCLLDDVEVLIRVFLGQVLGLQGDLRQVRDWRGQEGGYHGVPDVILPEEVQSFLEAVLFFKSVLFSSMDSRWETFRKEAYAAFKASTTLLTPCALCRFFSKRITAFAVDREVGRSNRGLMDSVSSIVYHVYSPRIGCKEHGS